LQVDAILSRGVTSLILRGNGEDYPEVSLQAPCLSRRFKSGGFLYWNYYWNIHMLFM